MNKEIILKRTIVNIIKAYMLLFFVLIITILMRDSFPNYTVIQDIIDYSVVIIFIISLIFYIKIDKKTIKEEMKNESDK